MIDRLLRIAANRNRREEYAAHHIRLLRTDIEALRKRLADDRISSSFFFEAVVRAYLRADPVIVGLLEDARHEAERPTRPSKRRAPTELDEIYAAIGGDIMTDEE